MHRPISLRLLAPAVLPVALAGLVTAPFLGCGSSDITAIASADAGDGDGGGQGFDPGADGSAPEGGPGSPGNQNDGTHAGYCAGNGPPLVANGQGGTVDTCNTAKTAFRYAVCACDGFTHQKVKTDAFNGNAGPYDPSLPLFGGSVGVNTPTTTGTTLDVGGSFWVASGYTAASSASVRSEFHSGGAVTTNGPFTAQEAWVADTWVASTSVTIPGTLRMPAGKSIVGGATENIGQKVVTPVSVPPPCDCSPDQLLDVSGIVEAHRTLNDNVPMGVAADAFHTVSTATTQKIPCGRLFLDGMIASAPLTLQLDGRTAIFIAGNVVVGDLTIELAPGAEVDLFVEKTLTVSGSLMVGSAAAPSKARVYIGGEGAVTLGGGGTVAGNFYAPKADPAWSGAVTLYGALFAHAITTTDLTVHFDESILTGQTCAPPAAGCGSCKDCGNQACVGGQCGACTDSSQCCSPLLCKNGQCLPSVN